MKTKLLILLPLLLLFGTQAAKSEVWYFLQEGVTPNNGESKEYTPIIIVKDNSGVYWYALITGNPNDGYTGVDQLRIKLRTNADHYVNWFNNPSSILKNGAARFCMENNNHYYAFSFHRIDDFKRNSKSYTFINDNWALSLDYTTLYINIKSTPVKFNMYQPSDFKFNPDSLF